jgi:hypothetical protein
LLKEIGRTPAGEAQVGVVVGWEGAGDGVGGAWLGPGETRAGQRLAVEAVTVGVAGVGGALCRGLVGVVVADGSGVGRHGRGPRRCGCRSPRERHRRDDQGGGGEGQTCARADLHEVSVGRKPVGPDTRGRTSPARRTGRLAIGVGVRGWRSA